MRKTIYGGSGKPPNKDDKPAVKQEKLAVKQEDKKEAKPYVGTSVKPKDKTVEV